jgi:galactokinase
MQTAPSPPPALLKDFTATFDAEPDFFVRAPGRADLIGSHTDYNEGWVLPLVITRTVWLALRATPGPHVVIRALDIDEQVTFSLVELDARTTPDGQPLPRWAEYPAGVAWSLTGAGYAAPGCQVAVQGDVPVGAGLSSSAAVETAYALAWTHLAGANVDRMALAQLCQKAENAYVGVSSGLMDQFACLFGQKGHALLFDTRTLDWQAVPLPDNVTLVVADTGTRRELTNSAYNQRHAECMEAVRVLQKVMPDIRALRDVSEDDITAHRDIIPRPARHRAEHIVRENARVLATAQALQQGDLETVGALMDASYTSMRDLFEGSGAGLDAMWESSRGHPARLGGRILGAGWAGCMIFLVWADGADDFTAYLGRGYETATGQVPDIYTVQSADGAQVV